jgi:pimeloyl-ACP methyl ester carboxylesterase
MVTLIALHGFTQNGEQLRTHLRPLLARLPAQVRVEAPDAPHACSEAGRERLQRMLGGPSLPPPHLCWWDATDDGRIYRGWETSLERLRTLTDGGGAFGLLGFSQGAIVTAALAALAAHGEFPAPRFAVLVAGRKPRADLFQPLFDRPFATPSLHVWGERDLLGISESVKLVEAFDANRREVATWPGPHLVPTHGPAAEAMLRFIAQHT